MSNVHTPLPAARRSLTLVKEASLIKGNALNKGNEGGLVEGISSMGGA